MIKQPKYNIGDKVYHITPEIDRLILKRFKASYAGIMNTYPTL